MVFEAPPAPSPCQLAVAVTLALVVTVWTTAAAADPDEPRDRYQGAFWAIQGHAGLATPVAGRGDTTVGPAYGGSVRLASILSIADIQATVLGSRYAIRSEGGGDLSVRRWSLGGALHVHPLFLGLLYNTRLWYVLGGIYASIGLDLDVTGLHPSRGDARREVDLGWHVGGGFDVPLTDPHARRGLWLGLAYRHKFLSVDAGALAPDRFDERVFLLTLAWRGHDLSFARAPRPTELRYQSAEP